MTALLDPAILGLVLVAIAYLKPRITPILTRPQVETGNGI